MIILDQSFFVYSFFQDFARLIRLNQFMMNLRIVTSPLVFISALVFTCVTNARYSRYTKSLVAVSRFEKTTISKVVGTVSTTRDLALSKTCHQQRLETCCVLPDNTLVFTQLIISGGITDTEPGDKALCLTQRPVVIFPSPCNAYFIPTRLFSTTKS